MTELPDQISETLQCKAIPLEHLGVNELAWLYEDVLCIIENLKETSIAILGGDVLCKDDGKYVYEFSSWHTNIAPDESWDKYADRTRKETIDYLHNFPNSSSEKYAFIIALKKEEKGV